MQLLDCSVNYSRDLSLKELPTSFLLHNNVVSEVRTPQLSPRPFRFSIKKYSQNDLRLLADTYYNSLIISPDRATRTRFFSYTSCHQEFNGNDFFIGISWFTPKVPSRCFAGFNTQQSCLLSSPEDLYFINRCNSHNISRVQAFTCSYSHVTIRCTMYSFQSSIPLRNHSRF